MVSCMLVPQWILWGPTLRSSARLCGAAVNITSGLKPTTTTGSTVRSIKRFNTTKCFSSQVKLLIVINNTTPTTHAFLSLFPSSLIFLDSWIDEFVAMETPDVSDSVNALPSRPQSRSLWSLSPSRTLTVQMTTRSTSSSRRGRWRPGSGTRGSTAAWLESARYKRTHVERN